MLRILSKDDAKEIISEREFLLHARLANQRGLIYRAENDIEKALTAHMSARDYSVKLLTQESDLKPEDSKNYNMMKIYAMACQNMVGDSLLGELFLDLEHVAKEAMDAFSLIGDKQGMVNCLLNKGHIYRRRKDKLAAIDSFERASEFADDIDGNERTKTIVNLNLAILCLQQKDDTLATYNLNRLVIGVATETLSRHDKNSVLPLFDELKKLYSDSSLKIKDFERISAVF